MEIYRFAAKGGERLISGPETGVFSTVHPNAINGTFQIVNSSL
jgi:hypothetical protein